MVSNQSFFFRKPGKRWYLVIHISHSQYLLNRVSDNSSIEWTKKPRRRGDEGGDDKVSRLFTVGWDYRDFERNCLLFPICSDPPVLSLTTALDEFPSSAFEAQLELLA